MEKKKLKIPKKVEEYIRKEIAIDFESVDTSQKHIGLNLQKDVWNEEKFDRFTLDDFDKEDYWIIKPAFMVLKWLREQKGGLNSSQP